MGQTRDRKKGNFWQQNIGSGTTKVYDNRKMIPRNYPGSGKIYLHTGHRTQDTGD